jgi:NAD(P)-dependent dehydrogenase (short-subunit alcohol dehydrogenase family)
MMRFTDQVAIVTGAAGGIGRAICARLRDEGARVVLADLDAGHVQAAAGEISSRRQSSAASADVLPMQCDVSDEAAVERACQACIDRWGRLDVVVNNAGLMTFKPIIDLTEADWLKVLKVDLLGAAYFVKHAFRRMKPGGSIVNVSSIHALQTSQDAAPYAAAKAGLVSLTRSASIEGRALGIRVNALLPGAVDTPMLWDNPNVKSGVETVDRSAVGRPEDMAGAVAFLASSDAAYVNGAALVADGGRLSRL